MRCVARSGMARQMCAVRALSALIMVLSLADAVSAQSRREAGAFDDPGHRSVLVIPPAGASAPQQRKVVIGLDKSMLVEVPVDLNNVLVSNPDILDAVVQTSRQVYLLAKDVGEANAFFFGPNGQKVLLLEVSIRRDLTLLMDTIQRLLPGSRVRAEMMGDTVVLSGTVASPIDANRAAELAGRFVKRKDQVVNLLTSNTKEQVLLKVTVAEMQRDAMRRIGVDLSNAVLNRGEFTFAKVMQNAFPLTSPAVAPAQAIAAAAAPIVTAGSALQGTWTSGNQSITSMMQALERSGVVRTLAEPNLTAVSGETAKFLAGGEFPIPVAQDNNKVTVDWKPFGVNVSFKPVVMTEGKISLTISAEVSEIATENSIKLDTISLPGLKVRRAETTLELPSGGTLAMAGLLSEDTRQSVEGMPGLKNLPVLGALFRSNDYRKRETELVILVTPYLATHAPRQEMATPDQGFMPSHELRELFFGRINRVYGRSVPPPPRGRYHGNYGFIIEYPDAGVKG
jgi:pilus assembly protein CpaC